MKTVFKNAKIIDGLGSAPFFGDVSVENGVILSVGNAESRESDDVRDMTGRTLMPALTDAHVHFGGACDFEHPPLAGANATDEYEESRRLFLDYGVTSVRSGGDYEDDMFALREKNRSGELEGPRVFIPGRAIQPLGGHPAYTVYGADPEIIEKAFFVPISAEDACAEVHRQAKKGVDHIKAFLADDNYADPSHPSPKLDLTILRAVVDEAHRAGLRVMCHCQEPQFTLEALECGCDTTEHTMCGDHALKGLPKGLIELYKKTRAIAVPTAATAIYYRSGADVLEAQARIIRAFYDGGVTLAAGTDCGTPSIRQGESLHTEMERFAAVGVPILDAIRAATYISARVCGRNNLGAIKEGFAADLLVLEKDPMENISFTRSIQAVMQAGKFVRE